MQRISFKLKQVIVLLVIHNMKKIHFQITITHYFHQSHRCSWKLTKIPETCLQVPDVGTCLSKHKRPDSMTDTNSRCNSRRLSCVNRLRLT